LQHNLKEAIDAVDKALRKERPSPSKKGREQEKAMLQKVHVVQPKPHVSFPFCAARDFVSKLIASF
jgi:hypothetical protein